MAGNDRAQVLTQFCALLDQVIHLGLDIGQEAFHCQVAYRPDQGGVFQGKDGGLQCLASAFQCTGGGDESISHLADGFDIHDELCFCHNYLSELALR
jgi:hypothetical protein